MSVLMDALYCTECEMLMPCECAFCVFTGEPTEEDTVDLTHSAQCEVSTPDGTRCTCGIRTNKEN